MNKILKAFIVFIIFVAFVDVSHGANLMTPKQFGEFWAFNYNQFAVKHKYPIRIIGIACRTEKMPGLDGQYYECAAAVYYIKKKNTRCAIIDIKNDGSIVGGGFVSCKVPKKEKGAL